MSPRSNCSQIDAVKFGEMMNSEAKRDKALLTSPKLPRGVPLTRVIAMPADANPMATFLSRRRRGGRQDHTEGGKPACSNSASSAVVEP
jgi:hypothetical protein